MAATRSGLGSAEPDRIEARPDDFRARVRQGYLDQAKRWPSRYLVIDATCDADRVFEKLIAGLTERFVPKARQTGT